MSPLVDWLRVFAATQAVELAVAGPLLARVEPRRARRLLVVLAATLLTHPVVWFVFPRLGLRYAAMVWASELFAWLVEAALYARAWPALGAPRAVLVSAAANAASLATVALVRATTGAL